MSILERSSPQPQSPQLDCWGLDTPLLALSDRDTFTLRDACEGIQVFGGNGGGKTSGSGRRFRRAFLLAGMGGLVCCAKPDERSQWERDAADTGRAGDLVVIRPGVRGGPPPWRINFLDYERWRIDPGGGQTENIVNLLSVVVEIVEGKQGQDAGEKFWERAGRELLRNAVDLLTLAGEPITLDAVCNLVVSAPKSAPQPQEWRDSEKIYCAKCIRKAVAAPKTSRQVHDLEVTGRYWLQSFATLNDRTRTSITATFTSMADMLVRGLAWELLCTDTNIVPEVTYRHGSIIILDLSIQEYREIGRIVQGIWKRLFQEAVLRRNPNQYPRPVFLWCDESQDFISPYDFEYQAKVRSALGCTVYLTQNLSNYHARLGVNARANADALLGLFQTKIFHANADTTTNHYAAELIGKCMQERKNRSASGSRQGIGYSSGASESLEYKIEPEVFTRLRKGGPANGHIVEAVIFQGGRVWNYTGDTWLPAMFDQRQP